MAADLGFASKRSFSQPSLTFSQLVSKHRTVILFRLGDHHGGEGGDEAIKQRHVQGFGRGVGFLLCVTSLAAKEKRHETRMRHLIVKHPFLIQHMLRPLLEELLDGEVGPETLSEIPKNVIVFWVRHTPVQGTELVLFLKVFQLHMKTKYHSLEGFIFLLSLD